VETARPNPREGTAGKTVGFIIEKVGG
jgi:hypothetical protein